LNKAIRGGVLRKKSNNNNNNNLLIAKSRLNLNPAFILEKRKQNVEKEKKIPLRL
jgi:hypothetical protein